MPTITIARTTGAYSNAATLGFVTGLRSQLPLALLTLSANRGAFAARAPRPLSLLRSRRTLAVTTLAALGELVADKLPSTPSRLKPGPLGGRLAIGTIVGAAVSREAGLPAGAGALLGAAGAAAGSFAGYHARTYLGRATGLRDAVWAVAEDATALALGSLALRRTPA